MKRGLIARARTTRATASASERARGRGGIGGVEHHEVGLAAERRRPPPRSRRRRRRRPSLRAGRAPDRRRHAPAAPPPRPARRTRRARPPLALGAAEGVRGARRDRPAPSSSRVVPVAARQPLLEPGAVGPRRRAEDARRAGRGAARRRQRVLRRASSRAATARHRGVDQRDLRREHVAEQPRDAPGHVDPRPADRRRRQHLDAGDPAGRRRPIAGRQPISASPCAISSPPVRRLALPQRSMHQARGQSPCSWTKRRSTSSAAAFPSAKAVGVGMRARIGGDRGCARSAARRRRPRAGAPDGPGATCRPSSAAISAVRSRRGAGAGARRRPRRRVAAVDVQPVLDREVLEVAEPGVDARSSAASGSSLPPTPASPREPGLRAPSRRSAAPAGRAAAGRARRPARIRRPAAPAPAAAGSSPAPTSGGVRCPMRHRRDPPLGLRRLAGVADDEGIDDRQRPGDHFGKAGRRQRHRLARQPFERAVRADMHQRMQAERLAQPEPEGDQRMARRQRRVVIVGPPVARSAPDPAPRPPSTLPNRAARKRKAPPSASGSARPVRPRPPIDRLGAPER